MLQKIADVKRAMRKLKAFYSLYELLYQVKWMLEDYMFTFYSLYELRNVPDEGEIARWIPFYSLYELRPEAPCR